VLFKALWFFWNSKTFTVVVCEFCLLTTLKLEMNRNNIQTFISYLSENISLADTKRTGLFCIRK